MNSNKKIGLLILLSSLLRMFVAASLELGNDEAYYQAYARHLQWSYFDHPPMVALLIHLSTGNLFFQSEFFIRLGPILCAAVGSWLIYLIGKRIQNERAGLIAAVLYNTSFYTSIIAGTFTLPDSPQVIFWLSSMYFMIRTLETDSPGRSKTLFLLATGICIGLCVMSKVHGIFLWFGFGGYIIFQRRDLLRSPVLWISGLISLALIMPIYLWNRQNHFITYQYHQGRIHFWGNKPDLDHLLQQILGSVFYSNPVNFILYLIALFVLYKKRFNRIPTFYPLLLWLSLPLIIVLLWTSLFNETLPHWSGPAYLSLMLLAACWLNNQDLPRIKRWLRTSSILYVTVVILGLAGIHYLPFRIGSADDRKLGTGDITLDMSGWRKFADRFDSIYTSDLRIGRMKPGAALISDYWFPAGHLDHYIGIPYHHNLLAIGSINDIHHFAWLNAHRPHLTLGSDAYFIFPSNYYGPPSETLKNNFLSIDDSIRIPQNRNGNTVRYFVIYRMHHFKGDSSKYLIPGIY